MTLLLKERIKNSLKIRAKLREEGCIMEISNYQIVRAMIYNWSTQTINR